MAALKQKILILKLLIVLMSTQISCFNVKFKNFYAAEVEPFNTQVYKREMSQFFDKASYSFNGFQKVESIPVIFPIDICILKLENTKYAASLHKNSTGEKYFTVFKMNNGNYNTIADIPTPKAIALDCISVGTKGYIAIAFNLTTPVENAREGSPIFQLEHDRLRAIQYFSAANLYNVYLRVKGNNIMLLQSFRNTKSIPNLYCPYFSWSGSTFIPTGRIPCSNARHLEPFSIDHENYVAVANYAEQSGRTSTYSEIYKFIEDKKKFQLYQKIKTNAAVDVRFFSVPIDDFRYQHFLVFGNSLSAENEQHAKNKHEADSVFYIYEKGQFVPYQRLTLYAVEQFLPIQNVDAEKFLLLVSSKNQDIKIYNLNDWKFEESTSQFTEGALSRGVARMRIFQAQDQTYLVIANELMTANETNIFLPIFKQEEHANALRQQVIDWSKANMERLKRINIDQLKLDVERKLLSQQQTFVKTNLKFNQIPTANIATVITPSLTYPQLNINSNYWKALDFANQALNALEAQYKPLQPRKREVSTQEMHYDFAHLEVGTLRVRNKLTAKVVNGVTNGHPVFDNVTAKQTIVTNRYKAPKEHERSTESVDLFDKTDSTTTLNVEQLILNGRLNGFSWHELLNNTLKRRGRQHLKSNTTFGTLQTDKVIVKSNVVNGLNLDSLVPIDGGDFLVKQDVLFAAPTIAKDVIIKSRLNQISLKDERFGALMKHVNKTQLVTGPKHFTNLRLAQPITLAGAVSSSHLRKILPNKVVEENLVLHGDYIINGDVMVLKSLLAEDIIDLQTNMSTGITLSNGLDIEESLEDVNIAFETPVQANNSVISFVNTQDMQQLVKTNSDNPQIVYGLKIFKNGLNVENGFCEVKILNGFDVENLEERLLLKDANQTIQGPMHIGRILAKGIQSTNLSLNNNKTSKYLTKSGNQHINGTLKVKKLEVETLQTDNLNTNGKILNQSLAEIYQFKSKSTPKTDILRENQKFNGTIYVKNLKINASLNEKTIEELEYKLKQLHGNIKYVGNYKINYNMDVANLTFTGKFNGIDAKDFGNCWLQKSGEQKFTAMQTFASAEFDQGATLAGRLNGYTLRDFIDNTYWINRTEFIKNAEFQNPIELQMPFYTNTLNKLLIPGDMLYRSSSQPQLFEAPIFIKGNLKIHGSIWNTSIVNDIELNKLEEYLQYMHVNSTLFLENANFSLAPTYHTLNHYDLHKLLDKVWLSNENIELTNHVEIAEGYFEGLLHFTGPINNVDLRYLKDNYLSKTRPQIVSTEVVFTNNVTFEADVQAGEINLFGPLIEAESLSVMNFDEFVTNSLKQAGPQEVHGNWTILEAVIAGNIHNVLINNLNLVNDVVRFDGNNVLTAEKTIVSATIEKLYTKEGSGSTVNNVDIAKWLSHAVYIDRNQTIYGLTTLENANLMDLNVAGYVNNIPFDEQHLMLTDQPQTVFGNISVRSKFPAEQRTVANNIKHLYAERINGFDVNTFLGNLTKITDEDATFNSHLIFEQPVLVNEYASDSNRDVPRRKREMQNDVGLDKLTSKNLDVLLESTQKLSNAVKDREFVLYDFELSQVIPVNATKLIPLTIRINHETMNVIGLIDESKPLEAVKFYYWSNEEKLFISNNSNLYWLPQDPSTLKMIKLIFGADYLSLQRPKNGEVYKQNIISGNGFRELLNFTHKGELIEPLTIKGKDCFAVYGGNSTQTIVIFCLNLNENNALLKLNKEFEIKVHAQQVLAFSETQIALLVENSVEIWNYNGAFQLHQTLKTTYSAKQLAIGKIDGITYLAVITACNTSKLLTGTVEIYSANSKDFVHQQTLDLNVMPQQILLSFLEASNDLLLFVRTTSTDKPLLIYQLKGVMGFQLISGPKTLLKPTDHMQILDDKGANKQFLVTFEKSGAVSFTNFSFRIL